MQRRQFLERFALASAGVLLVSRKAKAAGAAVPERGALPPLPTMTVYKSPSCGCCGEWVKHVKGAGFAVRVVDMEDLTRIKADAGVPPGLESCHTALVGTYVVEGHVPADLVKKMLDEKPKILGLSVPGMIVGSPGMEQGNAKQPYSVIAFARGGTTSVYARR
jgi:hypothetical protein